MAVNQYLNHKDLSSTPRMQQISSQLSSTQTILRTCVGWIVDLGVSPSMPFLQRKTLALINATAFTSLILALPGTFMLILMGFNHSFSLLISGVLAACLILSFNGARKVEWSKALFAISPAAIILAYTLLEHPANGMSQPLNYFLAQQSICFALLVPILVYGYDGRQKILPIVGLCLLAFLVFDIVSIRQGAFNDDLITGISYGLFTLLSLLQYAALAACMCYMQYSTMQQDRQAQKASEKLKNLAIRDGLTGLFNHSFIEQLVEDAMNRSRRSESPLALLMIDIDRFKQVNDTFGHNAGDEVLVQLATLLDNSKRSTDYLGRWGGDELVCLLTDTNLAGAENLAEKLRALVESHDFPNGKHVTISLGASQYQAGDTPPSFIARADIAMYRAKHAGRNRVEGLSTRSSG
jgi:diguanylate cyclase (GGDEF)-like protein